MALLMVLTMILPASLASYAVDPDNTKSPEVQEPEAPQDTQQPEISQGTEDAQQLQEPQELTTFAPLEDPEPADEPPVGEGTEASPYLIASVADLQWMRTQINSSNSATSDAWRDKYYRLDADIDMTDVKDWGPIGTVNNKPFSGTFDGYGHTISNMSIMATTPNLGLFGRISGATIKDLALVNLSITHTAASTSIGGIVGSVTDTSSISGCYVSGIITSGGPMVGGIVGVVSAGVTIENCRVDGAVKGSYDVGGIFGYFNSAGAPIIKNSLVMATVEGTGTDGDIGGIFGNKNNYPTGDVIIENCRVLSKSISLKGNTTVGAIYGNATGSGTVIITGTSA
jgi:hypothetical protein